MIHFIVLALSICASTSNRLLLQTPTLCPNGVGDCTNTLESHHASNLGEAPKCVSGYCSIGCAVQGQISCDSAANLVKMALKCDDITKACIIDTTATSTPVSTTKTGSKTKPSGVASKTTTTSKPVLTAVNTVNTKDDAVVTSTYSTSAPNSNTCAPTVSLSCTNNQQCHHLVDCFNDQTRQLFQMSGETAICVEGECTITCNGNGAAVTNDGSLCMLAHNQVEKLFPGEIDQLKCETHGNGKICKNVPFDITVSTVSTAMPDRSCQTADDCKNKASKLGFGSNDPTTYQEHFKCVNEMCTVSCTNSDICNTVQHLINNQFSSNHILKCETSPAGNEKICAEQTMPISTSVGTNPTTNVDFSCQIADDCKAKANSFGFGNMDPTAMSEAYACIDNMCTVTCNNYDMCGTIQNLINNELNTNYDLKCKLDSTTSEKVCLEQKTSGVSTTATPKNNNDILTLSPTSTDDGTSCDTDVCSATRIECDEKGLDGYCSVQFDFNMDVCILHHGFRRGNVYEDIRGACEYIVDTAGGICENGEIRVLEYDCEKKDSPQYLFDSMPTTEDQCPGAIDEQCVKDKKSNFAANIQGSVALFCKCENEKDLVSIEENLSKTLTAENDFVEQMELLSIKDDTLCAKGFGKAELNTLSIYVYDKDGKQIFERFDIAGGAGRYYYIGSVVALIILYLL